MVPEEEIIDATRLTAALDYAMPRRSYLRVPEGADGVCLPPN
jgi:hypothetical protein